MDKEGSCKNCDLLTSDGALDPEYSDVFNRYLEVVLPDGADEVVREFVKKEVARVFLSADGKEYVRLGYLAKSIENYIDKLREDLRKVEDGETGGDSLFVDRIVDGKEAFFSSIVEVREFFGETVEVVAAGKSYCVLKVCEGKNKGAVLFVRERNGKFSVSSMDIHSACRRMGHIRDSYEKEWEWLRETSGKLDKISARVGEAWEEVRGSEELDEIIKQLCGIVDSMKNVRNEHKERMKEQIRSCFTFEDKGGRPNPASRRAILVSVKNLIRKRIEEGERILGCFETNLAEFERTIFKQTQFFSGFCDVVETKNERLRVLDQSRKIDEVEARKTVFNLQALEVMFESLDVNPYFKVGKRMKGKMQCIIEVFKDKEQYEDISERERARRFFVEIYLVSKILALENEVISFKNSVSTTNRDFVYMLGFAERIKALREKMQERSVAPDVKFSSEINAFFGEVYKILNEVKKIAEMSVRGGVHLTDREKKIFEARGKIHKKLQDLLLNSFPKVYREFTGLV